MIKIDEYLRICSKNTLLNNNSFKIEKKPIFSIITPILNKSKMLERYMKSIQYQSFNKVEIILIDDHSSDNTIQIIEELKTADKRIKLIKNKKRKGTLISRNIGVFKSRGDYLLFVDPDDLISENILNHFYTLIKKYNYDLIRFNLYIGNYDLNLPEVVYYIKRMPLYKTNLFFYLFYGFGKLLQLKENYSLEL